MPGKKPIKKPTIKQAQLSSEKFKENIEHKPVEHLEPAHVESSLAPIIDKRSYDHFIKTISLRVYVEFEKTLKDNGVEKPELALVGFDLKKASTESEVRMSNYVALNARLIMERAFVDHRDYASKYMPRVIREMNESGSEMLHEFMESKLQHDIMMEIRSIAMMHIPEDQRFNYRSMLKVL